MDTSIVAPPIIDARAVTKRFTVGSWFQSRSFAAVDAASLAIGVDEAVGLVGESGCGKSTFARMLLMLDRPTSGQVHFHGRPYDRLSSDERQEFRRTIQAVFQDPYSSLNPALRVRTIIAEAVRHLPGTERQAAIVQALEEVGISGNDVLRRYPHEFSGGQLQRIALARALASNPRLIVLDEPTSSLDVSMRAQVLNLLLTLRQQHHLSLLFISHDILAVRHLTTRLAVMYLGKVVEEGLSRLIVDEPAHPYTRMLVGAVTAAEPDLQSLDEPVSGNEIDEVPNPLHRPSGCPFHPRCPDAMSRCVEEEPPFFTQTDGRRVACWLFEGTQPASSQPAISVAAVVDDRG